MTQPKAEQIPICEPCKREAKKSRLPAGWKRHKNIVYCDKCWRARYVLRAISIPVSTPEELSWENLRKELKAVWAETTRACNWMTTELYARDVRRKPDLEKLPPMPRVYLYPEARKEFPSLPPQTVSALENTMQKKYRARRYEVLWTAKASLPNYRYPTPFPVHNQSWSASIVQNRPFVSVRLGESRVKLRLKTGPQFYRQMQSFRSIVSGEAATGELAIYQRGTALMVKLVSWLPRPTAGPQTQGTLSVRTAKDSLLVAVNAKDETLWKYHGDHIPQWIAAHRKRLDRWSDDSKFENRPSPAFSGKRTEATAKFHNRMDSASHEIAAQLAGYASRRHFAAVEYNDAEQDFCPTFPWARLRSLIAEKLDYYGIELKVASVTEQQGTKDEENGNES